MKLSKQKKPYQSRIIEELKSRILLWLIGMGFILFLFRNSGIENWFLFLMVIVYLVYIIWDSIQSAKFELVTVEIDENNFNLKYLEFDVEKSLSLNESSNLSIILNRQSRGFFPLNVKKRVESIILKDLTNNSTILKQVANSQWKSKELHLLFYDDFEKFYNWHWRNKFNIKIVKNN